VSLSSSEDSESSDESSSDSSSSESDNESSVSLGEQSEEVKFDTIDIDYKPPEELKVEKKVEAEFEIKYVDPT
jgi:hypothetical protein